MGYDGGLDWKKDMNDLMTTEERARPFGTNPLFFEISF